MAITPSQWSHVLTIPESYVPSVATNGQTLVITEGVIAKLSAPDQSTFWSNVQNGGGDVRICTDSGGVNQLPVEVVGLDSVAETCVIWTRKSTYNGTGDLYVFIGKAGETQPPVTDPFGRNAVWSDFSLIIHEGTVVDSTGNHAPVLNGSPSLNSGVFGLGYDLQLGNQYIKIPDSSDISFSGKSSYCVDVWSVIPALVAPAQMLVDKSYTSNNSEARLFKQNGGNSRHRNPSLSPPNLDTADTYGKVRDSFIFNEGVRGTLSSDTQTGSGSVSGSISRSSDDLTIGSDRKDEATGGALPLKGVISDVWIQFNSIRSDDVRSTEYANQNDPATFFGTPTIAETGGGTAYSMTLEGGDYTLICGSLSLLKNRAMRLDAGAYSLTDGSATLVANRVMQLNQGSYSYADGSAYLLANRSMPLQSGSYTYTGGSATLTYNQSGGATYTLSLEGGDYTVNTGNAGLSVNRTMQIDGGPYIINDGNSNLLFNRKMQLDGAAYLYTPGGVTILARRRMTLEGYSYNYTGGSVTLSYSGEVIALISGYTVQYKSYDVSASYIDDYIKARFQ